MKLSSVLLGGSEELWSFMSQCRNNSARGKVIDKNWFIRIGCLWDLQAGRQEVAAPQELTGLQLYNQKVRRRRRRLLRHSWVEVMLPSFVPPPGWAGEFSCPYVVKLGSQIIVFLCLHRACPNLLSSLVRMWGSCYHCFLVWGMSLASVHGFVAKQACLALWLSKPSFLSNH